MDPPGVPGRRHSRPATGEPSGLTVAGSPAAGVSVTAPPFFPPPPRSRPPSPPLHTRHCRRLGRKARAGPDPARPPPTISRGPRPPPGPPRRRTVSPRLSWPRRLLELFAGPQTPARSKCVFFIPVAGEKDKFSNPRRPLLSLRKKIFEIK